MISNYHKRVKRRINAGYSELKWKHNINFGRAKHIATIYQANNIPFSVIFFINKDFSVYTPYFNIDRFFEQNGIRHSYGDTTNHIIDFPYSIEPNLKDLKIILQLLLDSYILERSLKIDNGEETFCSLTCHICGF